MNKRIQSLKIAIISLCLWFQLSNFIYAQATDLPLIPVPQQVIIKEGAFRMNEFIPVFLDKKASLEESRAVSMLCEGYLELFGKELPITHNQKSVKAIFLRNLSLEKQSKNEEKMVLPVGEQGYQLNIFPDKIEIIANSNAGLFYGTQTLLQLFRASSMFGSLECMTINDMPFKEHRGWKLNLYEGCQPSFEYLKELIKISAHYKYNAVYIGQGQCPDALSEMELFYLEKFATNYHVSLIFNDSQTSINTSIKATFITDNNGILYPEFRQTAEKINTFSKESAGSDAVIAFPENKNGLFLDNWYHLLWGGNTLWNPVKAADKEVFQERWNRFDKALNTQFFETEFSLTKNIQKIDSLRLIPLNDIEYARAILYTEIPDDAIYINTKPDEEVLQQASKLEESLSFITGTYRFRHEEILYSTIFATQKIALIAVKNIARAAMTQMAQGQDINRPELENLLKIVEQNAHHLRQAHSALWSIENRSDFPTSLSSQYDRLLEEVELIRTQLLKE